MGVILKRLSATSEHLRNLNSLYIYILWYREVQQKLPGGPSSKRGIQKAETEI